MSNFFKNANNYYFLIWIVVYLATFFNIFNSCIFFLLLWTENNPIFWKIPNFNISENNPVNTLDRCKEVNKKVEWFLRRGFVEFLHSNLLEAILYKDTRQPVWRHPWRSIMPSMAEHYHNPVIVVFVVVVVHRISKLFMILFIQY